MNQTVGMTLDCVDVKTAAIFWKAALGYDEPVPFTEGAQFHGLVSPGGGLHHLTLQSVKEPKDVKNRAHLDLFVDDLDSEVSRLAGLGARTLEEHNDDGGYRTAVLADPLGNEFCVVQR
ncbi:VOC family protein [Rhodococcus sp. TAF43]|uniref:VOC family protein n=1 Tax=Rhodococcus sp. TAF43 TaxID=3237483 RepID=UPI003F974E0B